VFDGLFQWRERVAGASLCMKASASSGSDWLSGVSFCIDEG
jgi:hypothetical protein